MKTNRLLAGRCHRSSRNLGDPGHDELFFTDGHGIDIPAGRMPSYTRRNAGLLGNFCLKTTYRARGVRTGHWKMQIRRCSGGQRLLPLQRALLRQLRNHGCEYKISEATG